jgi:pimeloyl-ACP methyl ester carboxylesterase
MMRAKISRLANTAILSSAVLAVMTASAGVQAAPALVARKNIVIVPGAFIDGSTWHVVHDILANKGYNVTVVPATHVSLDDDVSLTRRALSQQVGKVVLVGNGIGGAVISHAGDGGKVSALVYVAALVPEVGENPLQLLRALPAAASSIKPDWSGVYWADRAHWREDFGADLSPNRANFLAASQTPVTQLFMGTSAHAAVWHHKPSYAVVATADRVLNPDTQRMMYSRAHAKVTEIAGSHAVHVSRPEDVARVIEQAAIDNL